jgi:leader peptidase (prepilin peptidase)/N-methyltransferase
VDYLILFFIFVFGLIIGSFLNVVILRYNTGMSINGRSGCFSCGKKLEWYELVPVLSFLIQKGKCRKCGARLSWQYPIVEALTGVLFVATFLKYKVLLLSQQTVSIGVTKVLFFFVIWSILEVIVVYDIRHKIIPDGFVYAFDILALLHILIIMRSVLFSQETLYAIIAGPILCLPFFLLWLLSQGKWIGFGDVKLALGMGWMLGLIYGFSAIVLSFWIGAAFSILQILISQLKSNGKQLTMKSEIPFAPYLILGLALVYFFQIDVLGLGMFLGM